MLEWLRRHDRKLDEHLRTYLFTNKRLLEIEEEAEGPDENKSGDDESSSGDGSLGIGSLRK
jgi:hypothetical protein